MAKDEVRTNVFAAKKDEPAPKKQDSDEDGEIAKGQAAKLVRQTLEESFETLRVTKTKEMVEAKNPEAREQAWHRLKALEDLKLELEKAVSRGEIALIKANKPL